VSGARQVAYSDISPSNTSVAPDNSVGAMAVLGMLCGVYMTLEDGFGCETC